jgi:hypothetical protein
VRTWVSDQGSHFKNRTIEIFRRALRIQHHFTTAYTPWANGTVERACREVLRAARALQSEFRVRPTQWPAVYPVIQAIINNSPSPQRDNITKITAFTGLPADNPLLSIAPDPAGQVLSISAIRARQVLSISEWRESVEALHKRCNSASATGRDRSRSAHANKCGVAASNFDVGHFVLEAQRDTQAHKKLSLKWRGPKRVLKAISDYVFIVEDLGSGHSTTVHGSRLRFYHDASLDVTTDLLAQVAHNDQGYDVQSIMDIRLEEVTGEYQLLISWLGFDTEDGSWEPLRTIYEDVRQKVEAFFALCARKSLVSKAIVGLG